MNVFEWRQEPLQESELPAIEYRDETDEINDEGTLQTWGHNLTIKLRISAESMAAVRAILGDIQRVIGEEFSNGFFSQNGMLVRRGTDESEVEHKERKYASCIFPVYINYTTTEWDAYNP